MVIGAGAIGAPIAAQLYEHGHPVVLVARGANYDVIAADGVEVATPERTRRSKVDVVNGVSSLATLSGDVVVLCVKSQDTPTVLEELVRVTSPDTAVFCAQNGVANERAVSQHFANTYGVCVMSPASYLEPGRVEVFSSPVIGVLDVGRWPTGVDEGAIELAEEMSLLSAELSYLPERRMAYEGLARRTNHPGIKAVVTAMIQAERYGTPLGSALRVMAKENRDLRLASAEKKAAALPPKLTVPMIVFFLPVLFVVILGPALMKVQDVMSHQH